MKKHLVILGLAVLFISIGLSGCTGAPSRIDISVDSYYSYLTNCYITVDGIKFQEFSIGMFDKLSFQVDKSELPNQQFHTVAIYADSNIYGEINASCDKVTKSASFMLGSIYSLSCVGYE